MEKIKELERQIEVEKAKIALLNSLSSLQWGAMAKLLNEKYPSSHADKEKLLDKCLGR